MVSKPEESRKMFAQISPETVNLIAETLGIASGTAGLDSKVSRALAEDASYRVREVVGVASQVDKEVNLSITYHGWVMNPDVFAADSQTLQTQKTDSQRRQSGIRSLRR